MRAQKGGLRLPYLWLSSPPALPSLSPTILILPPNLLWPSLGLQDGSSRSIRIPVSLELTEHNEASLLDDPAQDVRARRP